MAEEFVERRCSAHSGEYERSCMNASNIDKIKENCNANVENLYMAIAKKTPLWTFLPLIAVLLSILALQWETSRSQSCRSPPVGSLSPCDPPETLKRRPRYSIERTHFIDDIPLIKKYFVPKVFSGPFHILGPVRP